jgi:hypothetical protein
MPAADLLGALVRRRGFHDVLDLSCLPELVPVLESVLTMPTDKHVQVCEVHIALHVRYTSRFSSFAHSDRQLCGMCVHVF